MKIKVEIVALKWDDFVLQEQLKSLMYFDHLLRGDPKKYKFIDELNFKNCMRLKIKTKIKFFVGITVKGRNFTIHVEYFDATNILLHPFLQNIKHIPNVVQDLSKPKKKALKNRDLRTVLKIKYTKYNASLTGMV